MPMRTRNIRKDTAEHNFIRDRVAERVKFATTKRSDAIAKWNKAEETTLAYLPEGAEDAVRRTRRDNRGMPQYTTIQVPYSYALLMAAHTYLTSVFFGRDPVHQFRGRHGEGEQQVQAVEALTAYQIEVGMAMAPYFIWIYDACKYGAGILESYWEREEIQYSSIEVQDETDEFGAPTGRKQTVQITSVIPGYEGNRMCNVSPYDFFHDPRVPLYRFQEGEFCGSKKKVGWNEIVRRKAAGYYVNTEFLTSASSVAFNEKGSDALGRPVDPAPVWEESPNVKHPSMVTIFEVHIEIIPKEWKLSNSEYPEKWVFTVDGNLETVIGAQPLGLMHGKFPFDVLESEVEGYGLFTRGIPEVATPIQNTLDWLLNTHFYNVRAVLNNQFIMDPSKIVIKDFEDGGPGFIARLRPEAYGSDIRTFVHQIPVADVTQQNISDMQMMFGIGERTTGINDQMFGVLSGGARKTATEVRTSTGFGVNRLKTVAEFMSATGISSHARKLVQSSQQLYSGDKKFRIVGELGMEAGLGFIQVTPDLIAGSYDIVPVDGTMPVDRMAQANMWVQMFGQLRNFPQIMMTYDLARIFAHVAQLMGIRNLNQFRIQAVPDQALLGQAQAGNVVPFAPPNANPNPTYSAPNPQAVTPG